MWHLQVSNEMHSGQVVLYNPDCKNTSSPEMCPNTWRYYDENYEWKIDAELYVECGMI